MAQYKVQVPFSGYVRGYKEFTVEADSAEEAITEARDWNFLAEDTHIVRDDSTTEWCDADAEEEV